MAQLFSNGVDTTLAATLAIGGTSATLTDGSGLQAPTGGDFELITLIAAGNFEIVRVTARATNVVTITRAQEGTTAREWPSGTRVVGAITAGSMIALREPAKVQIGAGANASGTNSTAIGAEAVATLNHSVAVGDGSLAAGDGNNAGAVAVGRYAWVEGDHGVAIGNNAWVAKESGFSAGSNAWSEERWNVTIGHFAKARADYATVVGAWSVTNTAAEGATAVGAYCEANAIGTTLMGAYGVSFGDHCIGLGGTYIPDTVERVFQVHALPAVPRSYTGSQANAAFRMVGCQSVIMSEPLDLKTLQTHTIPVPSGATFFPEEVGVIVTAAAGVTGQPTIRFGITGAETQYLAATATVGLDAVHDRHVYGALDSTDGAKTLLAEITVAATGTTLTGRIYWKGFAVVDS